MGQLAAALLVMPGWHDWRVSSVGMGICVARAVDTGTRFQYKKLWLIAVVLLML